MNQSIKMAVISCLCLGAIFFGVGLLGGFLGSSTPVAPKAPTLDEKVQQLQAIQKNMRTSVCNLEGSKKSFEEVSLSLSGTTPDLQLSLSPIYEEDAKPRNFFREEFRKFDCNK